jgi:hypothetical protein
LAVVTLLVSVSKRVHHELGFVGRVVDIGILNESSNYESCLKVLVLHIIILKNVLRLIDKVRDVESNFELRNSNASYNRHNDPNRNHRDSTLVR